MLLQIPHRHQRREETLGNRRKITMSPHNPATREVIPEQYQNTVAGEPFLIYDSSVGDEERMFRFASETEFQLLRESEY